MKRVVADDLGADEAARDVAVDLAGGVELRWRAAADRPGAAFVLADGEERNVAEQIVAGADHAIEARLGEAQVSEKRRGIGGLELRRSRARSSRRARRRRAVARRGTPSMPVSVGGAIDVAPRRQVGFVEIDHDEQRLRRQELEAAQPLRSSPGEVERAQRLPVLERRPGT